MALPPTGSDAVVDGCAKGGGSPGACGPADGTEAESVEPSRKHPSQNAVARDPALVWVDDRQPVLWSPLQVEVIVVRVDGAGPGDLQGSVGDPPEQERGGRSGS